MRRTLQALGLVVLAASVFYAAPSQATDGAACWYQDLENVDYVTHPTQGGDNDFFTRVDVPPNLLWVLDNSGSMQTLSCNGACEDFSNCGGGLTQYGKTFFIEKGYKGYTNDSNAYDAFDRDFCTNTNDPRSFSGNDGCYKPGLVYSMHEKSCQHYPDRKRAWTVDLSTEAASTIENWCTNEYGVSTPPSNAGSCTTSSDCGPGYTCPTSGRNRTCTLASNCVSNGNQCPSGYACNSSSRKCETPTANANACITQLKTYGYHPKYDSRGRVVPKDPVFTGDLLNFFPPKHVIARRVLKDMVLQTKKARQGLMTFNTHSSRTGDGVPLSRGHSDKLLVDFAPGCDSFFPVLQSNYEANQAELLEKIDNVHFQGGTPLGTTLVSACQYISGTQSRFKNDVKVKNLTGVNYSDTNIPDRTGNADTMCVSCQKNVIAVITDGLPSGDGAPCRIGKYPSTNASPCSSNIHGRDDVLDSVADFCFSEDLRPESTMPGKQNATIHTVGFDVDAPILAHTAAKGGGVYYKAADATELRSALTSIVSDVNKRATSFSVASVTTVQTRGVTYAFVPRFRPSAQGLWEGHMYRFKLFAEFTTGCGKNDLEGPWIADKLKRNPNKNDSCNDVYLIDANNDFITETDDGEYVLADTTQAWTEDGWPPRVPHEPAVPVWNAATELANRNISTDPRRIYTVVDLDGDGVLAPDEMIEFNEANVDHLVSKLGLDDTLCTQLGIRAGKNYTTRKACALDVIRYVRGLDVFDENNNNNTNEMRAKPLGDIFHSSPVLVTNPVRREDCDLGLATQCLATLYSPEATPNGQVAYDAYVQTHKERDHFLLVGANDGMLHAFHAGAWVNGDDPDTEVVETRHLSLGTGRELWAFIPPDLLPKLRRLVGQTGRHELFVDGTAMVRDIWVDSAVNPGQKDGSEYRTIAVVGERQGGRSFFALDITNPAKPDFRWINPPPGDTRALEAGESWNDFMPNAPPIGAVALQQTNGPLNIEGVSAKEVWAVMLNGGYDPNFVRGRSISMLNVWTGQPLWHFSAYGADASSPQSKLFPVASTVTMLDLGTEGSVPDDIFDTAVVGDIAGQVWTLRFHKPGVDENGDGLMDNWFGARGFVQFKNDAFAKRSPFFQMSEVSLDPQTGSARAYLGSGDRANVRSQNSDQCGVGNLNACDCGLSNLGGCIRKGCRVEVGGQSTNDPSKLSLGSKYSTVKWTHAPLATDLSGTELVRDSLGPSNACETPVEADYSVKITCGPQSVDYPWGIECDPTAPNADCARVDAKPDRQDALLNVTKSTQNARFYAFNIFGDGERARFDTLADAKKYDAAALTDADLFDADDDTALASAHGYYIGYEQTDERTASPALVSEGCVIWNTLEADETTGKTACGSKVADLGRTYIADYYSGATHCGSLPVDTPRSKSRRSIVPPPAPTPVVSVNPQTGEVRYGLISVEPGLIPSNETVGIGDLLGPIHWLEVSPEMHQCRHGEGGCE